jgi:hypothetical protein
VPRQLSPGCCSLARRSTPIGRRSDRGLLHARARGAEEGAAVAEEEAAEEGDAEEKEEEDKRSRIKDLLVRERMKVNA